MLAILSAPVSRAELWTPVGQAEWHEGILTCQTSKFADRTWYVTVEQSDERPEVFRMQPYSNHPTTYSYDNVYVYIHTENPDKVYLESFSYKYAYSYSDGYLSYYVSQRCPENGFDNAYYGKISSDAIEFPIGSFAVSSYKSYSSPGTGTSSSAKYSGEIHKIVFPKGVLGSVPDTETFFSVGRGLWEEGLLKNGNAGYPEAWEVAFEKSTTRPDVLRVRPFASDEAAAYFGSSDDTPVLIHTEDPEKVYLEPYSVHGYTFTQQCGENKMDLSQYGYLANGRIEIPAEYFSVTNDLTGQNADLSGRTLVITLPDGYNRPIEDESGIFMGLISFGYGIDNYPIQQLTTENKQGFIDFVNDRTMSGSTYLYYAVDQAITALGQPTYPDNLNSVAMITFTDGADDGSLDEAPDLSWDDLDYQAYLKQRITDTRIKGLPIDAYSIGLKGADINDYNYPTFKSNLAAFASDPEKNAVEVNDMSEVEATFIDILDNLEKSWVNRKVICNINMRATGDKLRFTFDKTREEMDFNPENSEIWVEGTFSRTDNSINDIVYHGFTSSSGNNIAAVKVEIEGETKYQFTFENMRDEEGNILEIKNINYWHCTRSNPVWQPHTEFSDGKDAVTETERSSAAVMFVIDCSKSLGSDFTELQRTVNSLIERLADGATGSVIPVMNDISVSDDPDAEVEYYNLQGMRVTNPVNGIYIRRCGNNISKVLIKN